MIGVRRLARSEFLRNMATLMTGTAISQVVLVLVAPLLSRLYDPAAFGVFGLYLSTLSVLQPLAHLRYGEAIVLPREDTKAARLFHLGSGITIVMSAAVLGLVAGAGEPLARLLNAPSLADYLWWVPGSLLLLGFCEVLEYWAMRRKLFWTISTRRIARSGTQAGFQLGAGFARWGPPGLILGSIVGQVAELVALSAQVLRLDWSVLRGSIRLSRTRLVAAEYRAFALYGAPQNLLNSLSQSIPSFMLASFFGPSVVGLYAMAVRVLQLPASYLTQSLRQVYYQRAADIAARGEDGYPFYRKTTRTLIAVVAGPVIVVFVLAPWLFGVILGERWSEAGDYARWLSLWLAVGIANRPSISMLHVYMKQRALLIYEVALLAARVVAILIPGLLGEAYAAVVAYSLVGLAFNVGLIVATDRFLRTRTHGGRTDTVVEQEANI